MTARPLALWPSLLPGAYQGDDSLCAVSAHGVRIDFLDGRRLLCATSGLWNVNLGYANEHIADSVARALRDASYLSVFRYENAYARAAADALIALCGPEHYGRVIFSTSGGAANDLVMKVARHHHALHGATERRTVVGLRGSYHGLTYGSFGLTGEDLGQRLYAVDQRLIRHLTPNDPQELAAFLARHGATVAAVVVEPVLGTGTVVLTPEYVEQLLRLRDEHGFLLVADEVATGFGRTGPVFASRAWPAQPDILVASKGLTNGTQAAAAVVVSRYVADTFTGHDAVLIHGETQAGTPAACAAITATIDEFERLSALERGREVSDLLDMALADLLANHELVAGTSGTGCFRSVAVCTPEGQPVPQAEVTNLVAAIRAAGAVVHPGSHGFQLIPALTYTADDMDELFGCIHKGLDTFAAERSPAWTS